MAYRFKKDEALPAAAKRVFAEEISWAVGQLTRSKKRAEAIHEARKSIKKIRALLSLLEPGLKEYDRYFRNTARLLSDVRDDAVLLQLFDGLAAKHAKMDAAVAKQIRGRLKRTAGRTAVAEVVKSLRQAPALEMGDLPMQSVREAMAETYRRGRKALKRAEKDGTSESFHEFRKLAKQRWYHLRLFEDGDPTTKQLDDLHELETSLGDDHNLSVLRERLRAEAETNRDREQTRNLMGWIEEESQNLRRRALELGERLYSEKTANVPKKPAVDAYPFRARSAVA